MKELLEICNALKKFDAEDCVMATIIQVEGSSYRRPGARMLIAKNGQSWGMISGGCLEHDVFNHSLNVLRTGVSRIVRYDSTSEDDIVFGTGLGCNGIIDVFIEPVDEQFRKCFIKAVENCLATRQAGAIATVVDIYSDSHVQHAFFNESWKGSEILTQLPADYVSENAQTVLLLSDAAGRPARVFIQPLLPPVQLVIFGGWLDVVPLIRIGREVGFQVIIVDSRQRQSSLHLFNEADSVLLCSCSEALSQIHFDERTVAVLMNHHFEQDQEALSALTQAAIPFIGMLGPKRRQQRILQAVKNNGVSVSFEFEQSLHGPVGLDLGAKSPEEIALSITAEILAVLNERNAKPIRERLTPLNGLSPALAYA